MLLKCLQLRASCGWALSGLVSLFRQQLFETYRLGSTSRFSRHPIRTRHLGRNCHWLWRCPCWTAPTSLIPGRTSSIALGGRPRPLHGHPATFPACGVPHGIVPHRGRFQLEQIFGPDQAGNSWNRYNRNRFGEWRFGPRPAGDVATVHLLVPRENRCCYIRLGYCVCLPDRNRRRQQASLL